MFPPARLYRWDLAQRCLSLFITAKISNQILNAPRPEGTLVFKGIVVCQSEKEQMRVRACGHNSASPSK